MEVLHFVLEKSTVPRVIYTFLPKISAIVWYRQPFQRSSVSAQKPGTIQIETVGTLLPHKYLPRYCWVPRISHNQMELIISVQIARDD